ncbi:Uncharacterised protein [Mycobacteroides abscessus subsp. abscessus]|nr:Uncharacterised protein [Mycobacteroides abscessus subsp. abscessus]SII04546.1 Uncharacterised protein [Mycobacteroides abscessus subsp. abscessus]
MHDHPRGGRTVLAGVEKGGLGDPQGGLVDIDVTEHHGGCLAAELEVAALELPGSRSGYRDAGTHRSGDRNQPDSRMTDQVRAGSRGTQHHIEHSVGQDALRQPRQYQSALRGGVAGFEDDGVPGGQRRADLPDRHHEGVIPRGYLSDNPDGLAPNVRGEPLHVLTRRFAFDESCGTGEESDLIGAHRHLLGRDHGLGLSGVAALGIDDLVRVGFDGVGKFEQCLLAEARCGSAPGLEGTFGGGHSGVHVLEVGDRSTSHHRFVDRVDQVDRLGRFQR